MELFYHSSYIEFTDQDEILFKQGDFPKGFYWVLTGEVRVELPFFKNSAILAKGSFIGFENFIAREPHTLMSVSNTELLRTLFIDKRCYSNLFTSSRILLEYCIDQVSKQSLLFLK